MFEEALRIKWVCPISETEDELQGRLAVIHHIYCDSPSRRKIPSLISKVRQANLGPSQESSCNVIHGQVARLISKDDRRTRRHLKQDQQVNLEYNFDVSPVDDLGNELSSLRASHSPSRWQRFWRRFLGHKSQIMIEHLVHVEKGAKDELERLNISL